MIRKKTKSPSRKLWFGGVALLVIAAGVLIWALWPKNVPSKSTSMTNHMGSVGSRPAEAPDTHVTNPTPTPNPDVPGGTTGSNVGSTATLAAPTGTFVNNHGDISAHPVTSATNEASQCTTTPGATCDIQFTSTQTGATKDLGSKATPTTSGNLPAGSVSWNWTPGGVGIGSGTWKITAVASLDGQTKTTTDARSLTVQ